MKTTEPTIQGFIDWVFENSLIDQTYDYTDSKNCANAQYHRAVGSEYVVPIIDCVDRPVLGEISPSGVPYTETYVIEWATVVAYDFAIMKKQKPTFGNAVQLLRQSDPTEVMA